MKDDFAWGVCYGMDGKVRKELSHDKEEPVAIKITYLSLGPEVEKPHHILRPLLFGLLWLAERSWVHGIAIVLVQALPDA